MRSEHWSFKKKAYLEQEIGFLIFASKDISDIQKSIKIDGCRKLHLC
jgi:hypothetical protein